MSASKTRGGSTDRTSAVFENLARESFIMSVVLVVQFGLGIGVNLYVELPSQDHGAGVGTAISNGPLSVSLHAILGLILIVVGLVLAVYAIRARNPGILALSILGLAALVVAAAEGANFVKTGHDGSSMAMAMAWAAALLVYLSMLFIASRAALNSRSSNAPP